MSHKRLGMWGEGQVQGASLKKQQGGREVVGAERGWAVNGFGLRAGHHRGKLESKWRVSKRQV